MQRLAVLTLFFSLLFAAEASAADTAEAPPRPFGDGKSVVRIEAKSLLRWQQNGKTLLDLQGGVTLFQGNARIISPRLLVWFGESAQAGGTAAILDVYAEKGTAFLEEDQSSTLEEPALIRLTASGGLVLSGEQSVAGEPPAPDAFRLRAMVLHGDTPAAAVGAGANPLLGEMHPSAERTTVTDLSESGGTVTLLGNAAVFAQDMTLLADVLRVRIQFLAPHYGSPRVQSIYAEGSVDFRRRDIHITCFSLYIDGVTEQGLALNARVRTHEPTRHLPIQFAADAIREQSLYRFTTEGHGFITTSPFTKPLLKVESPEIQVVLGSQTPSERQKTAAAPPENPLAAQPQTAGAQKSMVVSASDIKIYADDIPIFYWPYAAKDVRTGTFLVKGADIGSGNYYGEFVKLQWDLYDLGIYHNDWSDLSVKTEDYSARGFGFGPQFDYQDDARHGFAKAYYIRDSADWDDAGLPVQQRDRGEATLRDREMLGNGWKADLEFGYLSDSRFLYTYDRRALDEDMDRQTEAFLSHVSENTMFTAQTGRQINNFQNVLEEDNVTYHVIGEPIGDTGLLWTTHNELAEMRTTFAHSTGLMNPDWVDRFDTAHEVSYPFQMGFIRAEPFLWEDLTGYNEGSNDQGSSARVASAYGVRAAANFYRTFDTQNSLFDVDRLRHIITPTVEYGNLYYVSQDPSQYVQNDEIDGLDESHFVTLGLLNRFQTYRQTDTGRKLVDFLTSDVKYHVSIHGDSFNGVRGDPLSENTGISPYTGDFIETSTRWIVNENIELSSDDDEFNVDKARLEALNGALVLSYWKPIKITLSQMYYLDPTDTDGPWHSISIITVAYQPLHSRWSVDFSETYDWLAENEPGQPRSPRNLGSAVYVTREMEGWQFSIGAEFNQGTGNGTVVMFRFTPPGAQPAFRSTQGLI